MLSTPAIHILKRWRPDLEIGVAVDDAFYPVYHDNPDVTHILTETNAIVRFGAKLVINLHGGTRSAWLTLAQRARYRAGFEHYRFSWLYNIRVPRAQEILRAERTVHTAEHAASAIFHLGAPRQEIPRARLFAKPAKTAKRYAVLHPFASAPEKCWPGFRALAEKLPLPCVIIGGPSDDFTPFAGLDCVSTPLIDSMRLIGGASLFIGNDSGPAHIAAAYGVPVVALFGPSDEKVWAPWRTESRVFKNPDLSAISVDRVLHAAAELGQPA